MPGSKGGAGHSSMRVLYMIDSLAPGGAERSLGDLAQHYASLGVDLAVAYVHERPGVHAQLRESGAELFLLDGRGRAQWARSAVRLVRERRPDLIHTTLFEGDIAGRVAGAVTRTPVVSSLVNVWYGRDQARSVGLPLWKVRAAQLVDMASGRIACRFHAVSSWVADTMARRLLIPRERVDVVPRGRDPRLLGERTPARRQRVRRSLGVSDEQRLLLAVARQEPQKGLDVLLNALSLGGDRPDLVTLVAGREGTHTDELRRLSTKLGLSSRVRWLGGRTDVPDLFCAADVFVLPSRWEGFPGVVLEAMALSVPIIATAVPSVMEAVGDCATLVPPGDHAALALAITDPTGSHGRVAAARRRFLERFTTERVAGEMVSFYTRALDRSRVAQP